MISCSRRRRSDAAALRRTTAVVRRRGHVLDGADLEADRTQGPDRRLAARTRTLDEHVDLLHAVVHRPAPRGLGGHLRGERRGLAGALEADGAGRRPRDHRTGRVGDGHDGVVERALDVSLALDDVLLLLAAHLLGARLATAWWHGLLGLLLAGDGPLGTLASTGVGLGALAADREALAVTATLVAADLDLAPDVGLDLATEVTLDLDLVVALDRVAELDQLLVAELVDPQVGAHTGLGQELLGAGTADAVDVGECDLDALVAREVDANEACHQMAVPSGLSRWFRSCRVASASDALRPLLRRWLHPSYDGPAITLWGVQLLLSGPSRASSLRVAPRLEVRTSSALPGRCSPLALLVARVLADHHDAAVATDHLALVTDLLDARVDLHVSPFWSAGRLLVPVDDPTPREVVRRELHHHAVLGEHPYVVLAHLAADVGQDLVTVAELDPEHRVRESLDDGALDLDHTFFFRHVLTSGRGSSRLPSTREPPRARRTVVRVDLSWPLRRPLPGHARLAGALGVRWSRQPRGTAQQTQVGPTRQFRPQRGATPNPDVGAERPRRGGGHQPATPLRRSHIRRIRRSPNPRMGAPQS